MSINLEKRFSQINSVFYLANQQPQSLFISQGLSITREKENKLSPQQALDEVISFLSQKALHSEESLSLKMVSTFKENLVLFMKDSSSLEVQKKMNQIDQLLENCSHHAKLNRILKQDISLLNKDEVDFLHRTLSYFAFEHLVLNQALNTLAKEKQNEELMVHSLNLGVLFTPKNLNSTILSWTCSIPLSLLDSFLKGQEKTPFSSALNNFVNAIKSQKTLTNQECKKIIKHFIEFKNENSEKEKPIIDLCLMILKLHQFIPIANEEEEKLKEFTAVLKGIFEKQSPLYTPSLEELHPLLVQIAHLVVGYYRSTAEETKQLLSQIPIDFDYESKQADLLYKSIIESEYCITSEYLANLETLLKDYQESFDKKCLVYFSIYNKLIAYRNSFKNRSSYMHLFNYHNTLSTQSNRLSEDLKSLPHPEAFKTQGIQLPSPFIFTEDELLKEMQPLPYSTTSHETKKTAPTRKTKTRKNKSASPPVQYFDFKKLPFDIAKRLFFFLSTKDLIHLGLTDRHLHQMTQTFFNDLKKQKEEKSRTCILSLKALPESNRPPAQNSQPKEKNEPIIQLVPSLPDQIPPFSWKELQHSPNILELSWVKKINTDPFARSLPDPIKALETNFGEILPDHLRQNPMLKSSALFKVAGWLMFTQKVLELKTPHEKMRMIQKFALGKTINQCAQLLNYVRQEMIDEQMARLSIQLIDCAIQVLQTTSQHYFFYTSEWKEGLKSPKSAEQSHENLDKALEIMQENKEKKTCVVAWDTVEKRLMLAKSGRMWAVNPRDIEYWKIAQQKYNSSLQKESFYFTKMTVDEPTVQMLFQTLFVFSQFCEKNKDIIWPENISNFNKIRGDFVKFLGELHQTRPKVKDRMLILSLLYRNFSKALPYKKWVALFHLFQNDRVSQQELMEIVMEGKCTKEQGMMMLLCHLPCGEVKIALDCCRELSPSSRQNQCTLGERLQFSAFKADDNINQSTTVKQGLSPIDICQKCHDLWPVFETLYWSLKTSGIDMSLIENLDKHVKRSLKKA